MLSEPEWKAVVGFDIGTSYCGLAYSFSKDPSNFQFKSWNVGIHGTAFKTPTTLLLKPNKDFHAFGYDAESKYRDLLADKEHEDWFYLRQLKLSLYNSETQSLNGSFEDVTGKAVDSLHVISLSIRYMKNVFLDILKSSKEACKESEIKWVLTVPTVWYYEAEEFMKTAAKNAGIQEDQFFIVMESIATTMFCKYIVHKDQLNIQKFMVLHAGGRETDITLTDMWENGDLSITEVFSTCQWSGSIVEAKFKQILVSMFGERVMSKFRQHNFFEYLELLREFERIRNHLDSKQPELGYLTINFARELIDVYRDDRNENESVIEYLVDGNLFKWHLKKVEIHYKVLTTMFEPALSGILEDTNNRLKESNTAYLFVVGGFAESQLLKEHLKENLEAKGNGVNIPEYGGLAIIKGAVCFGYNAGHMKGPMKFDIKGPCLWSKEVDIYTPVVEKVQREDKETTDKKDTERCLKGCKGPAKYMLKGPLSNRDLGILSRQPLCPNVLGIALDIPDNIAENIKSNHRDRIEHRRFYLLKHWNDEFDEACLERLIDELRDCIIDPPFHIHTICKILRNRKYCDRPTHCQKGKRSSSFNSDNEVASKTSRSDATPVSTSTSNTSNAAVVEPTASPLQCATISSSVGQHVDTLRLSTDSISDCQDEWDYLTPSQKTLKKVADHIGNKMFDLGLELRMSSEKLEEIEKDCENSENQSLHMLQIWHENGEYTPCIRILACALREVGVCLKALKGSFKRHENEVIYRRTEYKNDLESCGVFD